MTSLLVNFDPLLELVYSWPLYEVIFDYLFLNVYQEVHSDEIQISITFQLSTDESKHLLFRPADVMHNRIMCQALDVPKEFIPFIFE